MHQNLTIMHWHWYAARTERHLDTLNCIEANCWPILWTYEGGRGVKYCSLHYILCFAAFLGNITWGVQEQRMSEGPTFVLDDELCDA